MIFRPTSPACALGAVRVMAKRVAESTPVGGMQRHVSGGFLFQCVRGDATVVTVLELPVALMFTYFSVSWPAARVFGAGRTLAIPNLAAALATGEAITPTPDPTLFATRIITGGVVNIGTPVPGGTALTGLPGSTVFDSGMPQFGARGTSCAYARYIPDAGNVIGVMRATTSMDAVALADIPPTGSTIPVHSSTPATRIDDVSLVEITLPLGEEIRPTRGVFGGGAIGDGSFGTVVYGYDPYESNLNELRVVCYDLSVPDVETPLVEGALARVDSLVPATWPTPPETTAAVVFTGVDYTPDNWSPTFDAPGVSNNTGGYMMAFFSGTTGSATGVSANYTTLGVETSKYTDWVVSLPFISPIDGSTVYLDCAEKFPMLYTPCMCVVTQEETRLLQIGAPGDTSPYSWTADTSSSITRYIACTCVTRADDVEVVVAIRVQARFTTQLLTKFSLLRRWVDDFNMVAGDVGLSAIDPRTGSTLAFSMGAYYPFFYHDGDLRHPGNTRWRYPDLGITGYTEHFPLCPFAHNHVACVVSTLATWGVSTGAPVHVAVFNVTTGALVRVSPALFDVALDQLYGVAVTCYEQGSVDPDTGELLSNAKLLVTIGSTGAENGVYAVPDMETPVLLTTNSTNTTWYFGAATGAATSVNKTTGLLSLK